MKRSFAWCLSIVALAACTSGDDAAASTANEPAEGSAEAAEAAPEETAEEEAEVPSEEQAAAGGAADGPRIGTDAPEDVAGIPDNAETTESGLASRVLHAGTGTEHPGARDQVTVHYSGWTLDGNMFDSSVRRGQPATFPLNRVISGWTEGLQLMVEGEARRFWIPAELAYGENAGGGRPSGMLVFDVELLEIQRAPEPPAVPEDVAGVPDNAETTTSGLASRVLEAGEGSVHPTADSTVRVHYSGWTLDGNMFDSSVTRGTPATFPLRGVIAGWTEGLQLMVQGEKRRFWIPAELAYGENAAGGRPSGMLVFDVELLEIMN